MRTHLQIIADAGGHKALAEKLTSIGCAVLAEQSRFWVRRKAIPPEYWSATAQLGVASADELAATRDIRIRTPEVSHAGAQA